MKEELTRREREILPMIVEGLENGEIADRLFISVRTVEFHVRNMIRKFGGRSRVDIVRVAARETAVADVRRSIGMLMLLLFLAVPAAAQFTLDPSPILWQPTGKELELAYLEKWVAGLDRDTVLLRPGQSVALEVDTTMFTMRYDSSVGAGNQRVSHFLFSWRNDAGQLLKERVARFPYTTLYGAGLGLFWPYDLTFRWPRRTSTGDSVHTYHFQFSEDSTFAGVLFIDDSTLVDTFIVIRNGENNTRYFSRVRGRNDAGWSAWGAVSSVVTNPALRIVFSERWFLVIETLGITTAVNPLNRQVKLRLTYCERPVLVHH